MTSEDEVVASPYVARVLEGHYLVRGTDVFSKDGTRVGTLLHRSVGELTTHFSDSLPDYDAREFERTWDSDYSRRERGIIQNCEMYAANNPSGIPGHQLMLLVAKMAADLDQIEEAYL